MSLPDRQLTLIETYRYFASGELTERQAEEAIKTLFLDIVGEGEIWETWNKRPDIIRAKLREKIEEL